MIPHLTRLTNWSFNDYEKAYDYVNSPFRTHNIPPKQSDKRKWYEYQLAAVKVEDENTNSTPIEGRVH